MTMYIYAEYMYTGKKGENYGTIKRSAFPGKR